MWLQRATDETTTVQSPVHTSNNRSNIVECYKSNDFFDKVERCFDIVAGVDGALVGAHCPERWLYAQPDSDDSVRQHVMSHVTENHKRNRKCIYTVTIDLHGRYCWVNGPKLATDRQLSIRVGLITGCSLHHYITTNYIFKLILRLHVCTPTFTELSCLRWLHQGA